MSAYLLITKGMAYRLTGRYEDAIETQKQALVTTPVYHLSYLAHLELAILYSDLNQIEDARAEAAEVLKLIPNFSVEVWGERIPFKDQKQIERDMAALRRVGLK